MYAWEKEKRERKREKEKHVYWLSFPQRMIILMMRNKMQASTLDFEM